MRILVFNGSLHHRIGDLESCNVIAGAMRHLGYIDQHISSWTDQFNATDTIYVQCANNPTGRNTATGFKLGTQIGT